MEPIFPIKIEPHDEPTTDCEYDEPTVDREYDESTYYMDYNRVCVKQEDGYSVRTIMNAANEVNPTEQAEVNHIDNETENAANEDPMEDCTTDEECTIYFHKSCLPGKRVYDEPTYLDYNRVCVKQEDGYSVRTIMNAANEVNSMEQAEVNHIDNETENAANEDPKKDCTTDKNFTIYFHKSCLPGKRVILARMSTLPDSIGPGHVSAVLMQAVFLLAQLYYFPLKELKRIKKNEHISFERYSGVEQLIRAGPKPKSFEHLIIPVSEESAKKFCSELSELFGMCKFFMTTEDKKCFPNSCIVKQGKKFRR